MPFLFPLVPVLMAAAVAAPDGPMEAPAPAKQDLVGKVREVLGSRERSSPVLALDDGSEVVLHGATERDDGELLRLAGVRVRVHVQKGDPMLPGGNHVRVHGYEILDIGGGVVPRIGKLASIVIGGSSRLIFVGEDGKADLLPVGWAAKMSRHVGAKMWLIGTESKGEFVPTRFAILRPRTEDQ